MKILILYFSGTGNSYYIANLITEKLSNTFQVEAYSIEQISPSHLPNHDILFLGFPVHETDSPEYLQNYIDRIPLASNKGLFIFCTHGGIPGNALRRNSLRLKAKGYILLGFLEIGMGDTVGMTFMKKKSVFARYIESRNYREFHKINNFIHDAQHKISSIRTAERIGDFRIKDPISFFGLIFDWLWKLLYHLWGESLKKKFYVDEKCTLCKICEKICPIQLKTI